MFDHISYISLAESEVKGQKLGMQIEWHLEFFCPKFSGLAVLRVKTV